MDTRILNWLNSLNIETKKKYEKVLNEWLSFKEDNPHHDTILSIESFLTKYHDISVKTTTLWSMLSPIKTFVMYTENGLDFYKSNAPFIKVNNWKKQEEKKKSNVSLNLKILYNTNEQNYRYLHLTKFIHISKIIQIILKHVQ